MKTKNHFVNNFMNDHWILLLLSLTLLVLIVVEFYRVLRLNLNLFLIKYNWLLMLNFNRIMKLIYIFGLGLALIGNWFEFFSESIIINFFSEINFNFILKY